MNQEELRTPIHLEPWQGKAYWFWGDRYTFKVSSEDTDGAYAVIDMEVQPGSGPPPHIHHAEDELFYVLDGELTFWCNGERIAGRPGTLVNIPRGTVHNFRNESAQVTRFLVTLVPGGFERFFAVIGTAVSEEHPTPPPFSEASLAKAIKIAPDYNLEFVT